MKKIVVINGSGGLKRSYTMKMVGIFEENLKALNPRIDVEYIHLLKKDLKPCLGCCRCLARGGEKCPLKDDAPEILEKMRKADSIIFAAPGYSQMVSGLYKNFMDRFMYQDHLPDVEFPGKPVIVISTSGAENVAKPAKYMSDMGVLWWGCNVTDVLGIASALFIVNSKYEKKIREKLKKSAAKLIRTMESPTRAKPNFKQYLYFMFNKTENQIGGENQPYRMDHWNRNNWMKSDFYYETTVNPLYKLATAFLFPMMKLVYRISMGKDAQSRILTYLENRY